MSPSPAHFHPPNPEPAPMAQMSYEDGIEINQFQEVDQTFTELLNCLKTVEKQKKELTEKNSNLENKINNIVDKLDAVLKRQSLLENDILDTNKQFEHLVSQISTQMKLTPPSASPQTTMRRQATFAEITKTGITQPSKPPNFPLPPKPATTEKPTLPNKLKKFGVTIRPKFGQTKPFTKKNPLEITNAINGALLKVNAKTDNTPIQIRAVTRFPSGNIRLFTKTRMEAKWFLLNQNTWTHLADPDFITSPNTYPILAHSCPTILDIEDKRNVNELLKQNELDKSQIHSIKWLGNPRAADKAHGTLLLSVLDKSLVTLLLAGGLVFNGAYLQTAPFCQSEPQCFNCLKVGHLAYLCKLEPMCQKCGKAHQSKVCDDSAFTPSIIKCFRCIHKALKTNPTMDIYANEFRHSSMSKKCPIKAEELALLGEKSNLPS
ncbi:hypothetical protein O181_061880 [Austropuccinia psidii MF-1]|uniref:CCHC-type domain-containing protein n=1 Tax=Austropuccinia psidii MF-1 TaxID=1389203 RepID=A0A9Q3EG11_9BASI|nr:hypothetical protein [Austropuccinia psidii MF-1]